jgi:aspartyl-tRNA(Asn)/glutamyl-tRNA(Gln) amidotransferase subunit C
VPYCCDGAVTAPGPAGARNTVAGVAAASVNSTSVSDTSAPVTPPATGPQPTPAADARQISRDDVAHLARLARLAVTDEELDRFAGQLDVILKSVARVRDVAAGDIPPTSHAVPMTNVYRADEVRDSLPRESVLAAAPAVEDDKFRVPRILVDEA